MANRDKILQFTNCSILRDHKLIKEDLWVRNGKIIDPEKIFFDEKRTADKTVDCDGSLISPGFIDIQINGGFGVDFSHDIENIEEAVNKVSKAILSHGVTSFCPTLVTSQPLVYRKVLPKLPRREGGKDGATILGVHVEGPFINKAKKGAHDEDSIVALQKGPAALEEVYGPLDNICLITLAPELPGALDAVKFLRTKNIAVSIGHSMGSLQDGFNAVTLGASLITHLFNAMLPFHHRDPGLVGLLSWDMPENRKIYYGIIADGVHTHPAALRIAQRTHSKGLVLVTDAISAMGLREGTHYVGQMCVEIRDGCAFIAGTNTLCGSIATMIDCVRNLKSATGCTLEEALEAGSLHPAEALGLSHKKGSLNFGADADFVMLTRENLQVQSTWIAGSCVFDSKS